MKITFYQAAKDEWKVKSETLRTSFVAAKELGKDFFVKIATEETKPSLRGFYRLCDLVAPYMKDSEGVLFDKDMVKEYVKQDCNYCMMYRGRIITKSMSLITEEQLWAMILRLYEICAFYGLQNYELTSYEKKAFNEFYKIE